MGVIDTVALSVAVDRRVRVLRLVLTVDRTGGSFSAAALALALERGGSYSSVSFTVAECTYVLMRTFSWCAPPVEPLPIVVICDVPYLLLTVAL